MSLKPLLALVGAALVFAAGPAQKIFPYSYSQEDLPNGLRLDGIAKRSGAGAYRIRASVRARHV
jgi:hypothetical protein